MLQVAITMMALALSEDSIRLRARRDAVIDCLGTLPDKIREVASHHPLSVSCPWKLAEPQSASTHLIFPAARMSVAS